MNPPRLYYAPRYHILNHLACPKRDYQGGSRSKRRRESAYLRTGCVGLEAWLRIAHCPHGHHHRCSCTPLTLKPLGVPITSQVLRDGPRRECVNASDAGTPITLKPLGLSSNQRLPKIQGGSESKRTAYPGLLTRVPTLPFGRGVGDGALGVSRNLTVSLTWAPMVPHQRMSTAQDH